VGKITEKSPASVYKLITLLEELQIIKEVTGSQRGRLYIFKDYLELFN
jgi:Fe2+ or Zn2+ uptake regulation protein